MPLQRSNSKQLAAYYFNYRRLAVAVSRFSVRMVHDDRKQRAAVAASVVLFVLIEVGMLVARVIFPAGLVGSDAPIIGNRDTGAVYARVGGRLYPAFNLTSARLVTASPASPKWVSGTEIAKYDTGPRVGIVDAPPSDMAVNDADVSAWAACDTGASPRSGGAGGSVTAIAGRLVPSERSGVLDKDRAVWVRHGDDDFVVWGNRRTRIDIGDPVVTVNLGLDPGTVMPMPISQALFDALPATEPLVVPPVPGAGEPSTVAGLAGAPVGSVMDVRDAAGGQDSFYVLLPGGVQQVSEFTANLMRTANSYGEASSRVIAPDALAGIARVDVLNVGFHPRQRFSFVDTAANPVLCVGWEKSRGDRQAMVRVYSGRALPVPATARLPVKLVRDDRDPSSAEATDAIVLDTATNFVATTSEVVTSETREVLWWLSPQGVRYGIGDDEQTLRALGLDTAKASVLQGPWTLLRMFAQGPVLSTAHALTLRDTVAANGSISALPKPGA